MLQLKNIKKDYPAGSGIVHALKGIDLEFRKSDFVSILGPSGCGKTTMLNIIGGLDQYTEGDLVINGVSTKNYKDRDWDTYRNHSIGFVFQSYNLIPHQSVLQNVELALTLSGVSRAERKKRAIKALQDVGLGDQLSKKPSQLSGGQMQRVAIARALVNNPDILLADEPTGALDTETSVQVMDILKEVSKERLVIMVTHNPDLAEAYSTRIIRMLDGVITHDSAPLTEEEKQALQLQEAPKGKKKREKKPAMRFATAFTLSLKNLISKKGRTMLTSFAGSIGIIGIALIFAVSQGMTTYINAVQEDTLSSYPLTLQAQHMDMGSLLTAFMDTAASKEDHENDAVYQKSMFYDLVNSLNAMESSDNDLKSFKEYLEQKLENKDSDLYQAINGVQYTYDTDLLVYTESVDGTILRSDSQELLKELLIEHFGMDLSGMLSMGEQYGMSEDAMMSMSPMGSSAILWQEILSGKDGELINPLLEKQYDVIEGRWPSRYDEIVLVVDENNEIDDMTLYALGLTSREEIDALADAAMDKTILDVEQKSWSYQEILDMEFRVILSADCYQKGQDGNYYDLRENENTLQMLYSNALPLRVVGILRPNEEATSGMLSGSIGYTADLTAYIVENAKDSDAVNAQLTDNKTDIFTGLPFKENTGSLNEEEKAAEFDSYLETLDEAGKAKAYLSIKSIPSQAEVDAFVQQTLADKSIEEIKATLIQAMQQQTSAGSEELENYIEKMPEEDLREMYAQILVQQYKMQYAAGVQQQLMPLGNQALAMQLTAEQATYTQEQKAAYYEAVLVFSESTYEDNLIKLGYVDLENPASINLYASSFENKDVIEAVIAEYNADKDELEKIEYTDYVGLMMSSITSIINAITYVLISFVAISLVVSSIMIGVITLISVQERTKEIGILRAIGASKRNVSSMFNAETIIIGFTSGALGVGITWLLCIPINAIIQHLTGLPGLAAYLPWQVAVILVAISMLLTVFSGIIPSRSAAKKDPVVALRTE